MNRFVPSCFASQCEAISTQKSFVIQIMYTNLWENMSCLPILQPLDRNFVFKNVGKKYLAITVSSCGVRGILHQLVLTDGGDGLVGGRWNVDGSQKLFNICFYCFSALQKSFEAFFGMTRQYKNLAADFPRKKNGFYKWISF